MRRWYWAAAVCAALAASQANADYIVIRMNIRADAAGPNLAPGSGESGPRGPGGMMGPGPGMGPGGGMLGPGPGGAGGPRGSGSGPAMGPAMGPGMGSGPGALGGAGNGPRGPGSGPAMGPAMGPNQGGSGGGRPGMGPVGPGMGPGMGPVGPGMGPQGGPAGNTSENIEFDSYETIVMAIVEVSHTPRENDNYKAYGLGPQYVHKWGQTALFNDDYAIQAWRIKGETLDQQFADHYRKMLNEPNKSASSYIGEAKWALEHGLLDKCQAMFEEAGRQPTASARDKEQLAAYAKLKEGLARKFDAPASDVWQKKLPGFSVTFSPENHYAIFHKHKGDLPEEVTSLGKKLEEQIRAYYLWFALKGKTLPFPQEMLWAVQVDDVASFKAQREALQLTGLSESFFAPRDNIAVFSARRLDEAFVTFTKQVSQFYESGWKRDDLLKGKNISNLGQAAKDASESKRKFLKNDYPKMQTLALLHKALEEEAERAAVSHDGTLQLLVATGILDAHVIAPEWVEFGFASLLETAKGPFPGADGSAAVALFPNYGAPSWAYLRAFRTWSKSTDEYTKFDPPAVALKKTVGDEYFHAAKLPQNLEIDKSLTGDARTKREKEIAKLKEASFRAKCQAWALCYFLAETHYNEFMAYVAELKGMPRDLEMDDQSTQLSFARAFKLTNAAGDGIDEKKWEKFAEEWFNKIQNTSSQAKNLKLDPPKKPATNQPGGFPGAPGGPGMPGGLGNPGGPGLPGGGKPGDGR